MQFNRFSEVVSLLVKIALNGSSASESWGSEEREWKRKVVNSLKTTFECAEGAADRADL